MRLFQDLLDQSRQLNQTPNNNKKLNLPYHVPNHKYKTIIVSLKVPNLPAPLHYLNFFTVIGVDESSIFYNESAIQTTALDTAVILVSSSPHMVGQLNSYSVSQDCFFNQQEFQFAQREHISGHFSSLLLERVSDELSFELEIEAVKPLNYFSKLRFNLAEHWSLTAFCCGVIVYKQQEYKINEIASFEFARSSYLSYLSCAFYIYQLINIGDEQQIIFVQCRNALSQLMYSRIYFKNIEKQNIQYFDTDVEFNIRRLYPKIKTPNNQFMYLPREFEWSYSNENFSIVLEGHSRGDFKFGLGAGFVGSFYYTLKVNDEIFEGTSGYGEYIDCRDLKWQEQNKEDEMMKKFEQAVPLMFKK